MQLRRADRNPAVAAAPPAGTLRRAAAGAAPARRAGVRLGGLGPLALSTLVLVVVAIVALGQGAASIPPLDVARLLLDRLPYVSLASDVPASWERIVIDVRLPRVLAAAAVGASLAYAGAAYQGVFRNPLASPFLLGVASGAALGAAIAIVSPLSSGTYGFGWVPVFAFAGGGLTVVLVYVLARSGNTVNGTTLILAGVALSAVFSAITSFMLLTGGEQARPIFSFLFGGFNTASWVKIGVAVPYLVAGAVVVALYARVLNVLQLDEEQAAQLGVDVARTKLIVLAGASLLAATAVAIAGVIGFVGLIVPHTVRLLFGRDYRLLLPASALLGAAFLIATDMLARTVLAPQDVPVGILTAILGGPFFVYLLRTRRGDGSL